MKHTTYLPVIGYSNHYFVIVTCPLEEKQLKMCYNYSSSNLINETAAVLETPCGHDTMKGYFMMHSDHTPIASQAQQIEETWCEIPDSEGRYEVSNYGRVRSYRYRKQWHTEPLYRCPSISNIGYVFYRLRIKGVDKNYLAHRLVMLAFVGPSTLEVNHKDGNKLNNYFGNLEYMTHRENIQHSFDALGRKGGRPAASETDRDREIRSLVASGVKQHEVARRYGISQPYVSYIVREVFRPRA